MSVVNGDVMTKKEYLDWAKAFFWLSQNKYPHELIAENTHEVRMWLNLFYWAGYKE